MSDVLINVENVSKKYCKTLNYSMMYGINDIGRNLLGLGSQPSRLRKNEFWAVDDVSFEVRRGEAFGLVGPNGSGKTTLLKMLNGIFWPDKGRITIKGRVGALIAVGAGFHPLLTGRENIYINGAILGMNRTEINKKFDAIVQFADIGSFLDCPVKHYSSGMFVRLGFAVAVHCSPDILLVDEVLAVGDVSFQIKCYQKMYEVKKRGTTIILVAHNIATIREQTTKSIYLDHGKLKSFGSSDVVTDQYIKNILEERAKVSGNGTNGAGGKAQIMNLKFHGPDGEQVQHIESGTELNAVVECQIKDDISMPIFGVNFYDDRGVQYGANSYYEDVGFARLDPGRYRISINFPHFYLPYASYLCSVIIAQERPENLLDWHNKAYRLIVMKPHRSNGSLKIPTRWQCDKLAKEASRLEVVK